MDSQHQQLLGNLAQDYYLSKMAISDISKKYSLSRYLIMKYLDEAFSSGIVDINIHTGYDRNAQLEHELAQKFNIKNIYVIKDPNNPLDRDKIIANFAANQIQSLIKEYKVIGLSWGETIYNVLDYFSKQTSHNLTFTQFMGENMKYKSSAASMRMVQKSASKYDCPYYTIPGPLYILNNAARNTLYSEPAFTQAFDVANRMDMLICGLGTLQSIDSIPAWHNCKNLLFKGVNLSQVAGMAFGRPYDINGNFLIHPNDDKTLSIPLNKILNVPKRLAIIQQKSKYQAVLGALRGSLFTDIILTESIALRITERL